MLEVTPRVQIPDEDLVFRYVRSGGPGGQHVNKVATKVELRFQVRRCETLSSGVKRRLMEAYPGYVTKDGAECVVTSSRYRTQARNRLDAERKLTDMIRSVLRPPTPRRRTRVPPAARRKRLESKRRRSETKLRRRRPGDEDA